MKTTSAEHGQNMGRTCSAHVLSMYCACSFRVNSMNNLLSYCGLVDARISASEKYLPVQGQLNSLTYKIVGQYFLYILNLLTFIPMTY